MQRIWPYPVKGHNPSWLLCLSHHLMKSLNRTTGHLISFDTPPSWSPSPFCSILTTNCIYEFGTGPGIWRWSGHMCPWLISGSPWVWKAFSISWSQNESSLVAPLAVINLTCTILASGHGYVYCLSKMGVLHISPRGSHVLFCTQLLLHTSHIIIISSGWRFNRV